MRCYHAKDLSSFPSMAMPEHAEKSAQQSIAERKITGVRNLLDAEKKKGAPVSIKVRLSTEMDPREYRTLREGLEQIVHSEKTVKVKVTIIMPIEAGEQTPSTYVIENSISQIPTAMSAKVQKRVATVLPDADDAAYEALTSDEPASENGADTKKGFNKDDSTDFTLSPEVEAEEPTVKKPAAPTPMDSGEAARLKLKEIDERKKSAAKAAREKPVEKPGHGWKVWKYITG